MPADLDVSDAKATKAPDPDAKVPERITLEELDGEEVDLWFRATACFRREDGHWRITHMHNSVPFSMDGSEKALLSLKP